jgi:hypothetical protein
MWSDIFLWVVMVVAGIAGFSAAAGRDQKAAKRD